MRFLHQWVDPLFGLSKTEKPRPDCSQSFAYTDAATGGVVGREGEVIRSAGRRAVLRQASLTGEMISWHSKQPNDNIGHPKLFMGGEDGAARTFAAAAGE
jgi:hypothetical protein